MAMVACTPGPSVRNPDTFKNKTGVVGVFRQPAFYCSEASPQYMQLGSANVEVKTTWSQEQDNMFFTELKPGQAILYSYTYSCGSNENKLVLDTSATSKNPGPIAVIVPESGLCKSVISFVQGDKLFAHNDILLRDIFDRERVAVNIDAIPYCEVVDNTGAKVSFADRDSLIDARYQAAIKDAADVSEEKIYPLVTISESSDKVTWNSNKSKVLMAVFTGNPDTYAEDATIKFEKATWAVSERELYLWFKEHGNGVRNWPFRFKQLFGMPRNATETHFAFVWVDPNDLMRPAFVSDVANSEMKTTLDENAGYSSEDAERMKWFKNWFDETSASRFRPGDGARPWTRLGYTYDWGNRNEKYGLTEFIIVPNARMQVRFTRNIKSVVQWFTDRNN